MLGVQEAQAVLVDDLHLHALPFLPAGGADGAQDPLLDRRREGDAVGRPAAPGLLAAAHVRPEASQNAHYSTVCRLPTPHVIMVSYGNRHHAHAASPPSISPPRPWPAWTPWATSAPTDVQFETIPRALAGKDLVVQSRTGTGKTAAFGIPIVERSTPRARACRRWRWRPPASWPCRWRQELAEIGRAKGVKVESIYGGDSMDRQLEGIRAGAHVIVGTPGRVLDHLRRKTLKFDAREACWSSTRPTACWTWASRWRWARSWSTCRPSGRRSSSRPPIPLGIRGLIYHYLTEPEWVLLSEDQIYVKEVEHLYCLTPQAAQGGDALQAPRVREPGLLDDLLQHPGGDAARLHLPGRQGPARGDALLRPARRRSARGSWRASAPARSATW